MLAFCSLYAEFLLALCWLRAQLFADCSLTFRSVQVRDLIDHERVLPLVIDNCGWNIQVREVIWSVAQPNTGYADPERLAS